MKWQEPGSESSKTTRFPPMPVGLCSPTEADHLPVNCNLLRSRLCRAVEGTPQWELLAGSLGNVPQGCIVLPKALRDRSERHPLIHGRDRDFAQRASREQRLRDVQAIGESRRGLTTGSREIQSALSLSWFSGVSAFGTTLRRDSAQPWLLQVGTPSFGSSHCVKTT